MDFGVVGFDNLVCPNSATAPSNNGSRSCFASDTADDVNKYGSGFLNQERTVNEDDLRAFKVPKTSSCGEATMKLPLQRCNNGAILTDPHQQMLSFSSQSVALPFYQQTSSPISRGAGYGYAGLNGTSMYGVLAGVRGPFTPSQWMELEHQALIYKYITANVPVPSYLLNPIRKALESCGFSSFSALRANALGWGAFHLGFSNNDPEPGRCRRTDGKKWRCSRDAVADQKYCERHMNRGRHRSRKHVESQPGHSASRTTTTNATSASVVPSGGASIIKQHNAYQDSSFRSVCSDSLLNPLSTNSSFVNCRNYSTSGDLNDHEADRTRLSISIPIVTSNFMSSSPANEKLTASPSRLSRDHGTTTQIGLGPLGEVLHNSTSECKNATALNLIDHWDHSPRLGSFPSRAFRGALGSGSRADSSKTLDGESFCNGLIGAGLILPTLPAL